MSKLSKKILDCVLQIVLTIKDTEDKQLELMCKFVHALTALMLVLALIIYLLIAH